ncbi:MAG: GNAT family N-acetyltransferase [Rickettsiales bacterium]|nr:GNAT family N-acetyltransferase [Rickettsiales bacterium]
MNDIFAKFPEMNLNQAILREIKIADAKAFYEYITDKNIAKYVSGDDIPSNITTAESELIYWINLFKHKTSIFWAIADKKNNQMIGSCGFNYWNREQRRLEISYELSYKHWGKGIAKEAVCSITNFGLRDMNAQRIQATVATDNERSIKLLESCQYQREGTLKSFFNLQGTIKHGYMYAKTLN